MNNTNLNIAVSSLQKKVPALLGASLSASPEQGQARFTVSKGRHLDVLVDSDGIDVITMIDMNDGRGELPQHCLEIEFGSKDEEKRWIHHIHTFAKH